jgi:hypothetical protein
MGVLEIRGAPVTSGDARGSIILAAMILGGMYAWRWLTGKKATPGSGSKPTAGKLLGGGELVSPEGYLVSWGGAFLILSIASVFVPTLAGAFALLIAFTAMVENIDTITHSANELRKAKSKSGRE